MGAIELRIVVYWTPVAAGGDTLACELCRTSRGIELRCISQTRDVIRVEPVASAVEALSLAAAWKTLYLADEQWAERPRDWDPETVPHRSPRRTVLEQRVEHRGTLRRSRA